MKPFFITAPIYYVNDLPSIGHTYTTFVCDSIARFQRLHGRDVLFSTGTDENSQKNLEAMEKAGETDIANYLLKMATSWKQTWVDLHISFDDFIRTTEDRHLKAVERFWNASKASGDIYIGTYEGRYCVGCERYVTDTEAEAGVCPFHPNRPLSIISESNYFFKLSSYRDELLKHFEDHPDFIQPEARKNEIIRYVSDHLEDISVSRSAEKLSCGIPVPGDESQRIYVWFDALINYMTVAGFGSDDAMMEKYWPYTTHVVGKDIIKFHCALWPAMILSASKSDPLLKKLKEEGHVLPERVFAHGFFTIDGVKISKSLGNAIDPRKLEPIYGIDAIRYFVFREITFGEDGDFSTTRLRERYVSDLSNTLGNLLHRTISMSRKYFDGKVPAVKPEEAGSLLFGDKTYSIAQGISFLESQVYANIDKRLRLDVALSLIFSDEYVGTFNLIRANGYIEETKPFKLIKENPEEAGRVLYALLEALRHTAWLLLPIMPSIGQKMIENLGQNFDEELKKGIETLQTWGGLLPGAVLPEPEILFARLPDEEKEENRN
jgi:methionyl-tRNA synthetase